MNAAAMQPKQQSLEQAIELYLEKRLAEWELVRATYLDEIRTGMSIANVTPVVSRYLQSEFLATASVLVQKFAETGYQSRAEAMAALRDRYSRMLVRGAFETRPESPLASDLIQAARRRAAIQFVQDTNELFDLHE